MNEIGCSCAGSWPRVRNLLVEAHKSGDYAALTHVGGVQVMVHGPGLRQAFVKNQVVWKRRLIYCNLSLSFSSSIIQKYFCYTVHITLIHIDLL